MHVIIAYDVRDDRVREKLRRLLWRYGLTPISKSVYAGRLSWDKAERLAEQISGILEPTDTAVLIPVHDSDFDRALAATQGKVWRRHQEDVIVVHGEAPSEDTGRPAGMPSQSMVHSPGSSGEQTTTRLTGGGSEEGEGSSREPNQTSKEQP